MFGFGFQFFLNSSARTAEPLIIQTNSFFIKCNRVFIYYSRMLGKENILWFQFRFWVDDLFFDGFKNTLLIHSLLGPDRYVKGYAVFHETDNFITLESTRSFKREKSALKLLWCAFSMKVWKKEIFLNDDHWEGYLRWNKSVLRIIINYP